MKLGSTTKARLLAQQVATASVVIALAACVTQKAVTDQKLFDAIQLGMHRQDVEKVLGKPVLELDARAYYGNPPKIDKWQSPQAPTSIAVTYTKRNTVQSKDFFAGKSVKHETK